MKKVIDRDKFKEICVNLLISFDKVCEEHKLRYILDFGTLLGAVRHKGFIPWDDDIDVSMPRSDYETLLKLYEDNPLLFGKYKLATIYNKNNIYKPFANLIDPTTITESVARKEKYCYPVWIDIFPADGIENVDCSLNTKRKISTLMKKSGKGLIRYVHFSDRKTIKGKLRGVVANIYNFLFKRNFLFYNHFLSLKRLKKADKLARNTDYKNGIAVFYAIYKNLPIGDISFYNDFTFCEFENLRFRIPKNYDQRLKDIYGNYMELPPEEERVIHITKAYLLTED